MTDVAVTRAATELARFGERCLVTTRNIVLAVGATGHQRFSTLISRIKGIREIEIRPGDLRYLANWQRAWWPVGMHVVFCSLPAYRPTRISTFFVFDPTLLPDLHGGHLILNDSDPNSLPRLSNRLEYLRFVIGIMNPETRVIDVPGFVAHLYFQIIARLIQRSVGTLRKLEIEASITHERANLWDFEILNRPQLQLTHIKLAALYVCGVDLFRFLAASAAGSPGALAQLTHIEFDSCLLFGGEVFQHWSGILRLMEQSTCLQQLRVVHNELRNTGVQALASEYWDQLALHPIHARFETKPGFRYYFETVNQLQQYTWDTDDTYDITNLP